jgi:cell wall-associated NlpC family hydrolase
MLILTAIGAQAAYADSSGGAGAGGTQAYAGPRSTGATQYSRRSARRSRHRRHHHRSTAGAGYGTESTTAVAGPTATIQNGIASPPSGAPQAVVDAIQAGNRIIDKPYRWGGGHGSFEDSGYDCSGSVSYALHGGHLLRSPLDSSGFESWGEAGPGQWITVYANSGHAYLVIAGIRLDTSAAGDPNSDGSSGPRWRPVRDSNSGYTERHPVGY